VEEPYKPIVVEAHAQTMAHEPRGDRVEDFAQRKPPLAVTAQQRDTQEVAEEISGDATRPSNRNYTY
jgi:hypothetical protein